MFHTAFSSGRWADERLAIRDRHPLFEHLALTSAPAVLFVRGPLYPLLLPSALRSLASPDMSSRNLAVLFWPFRLERTGDCHRHRRQTLSRRVCPALVCPGDAPERSEALLRRIDSGASARIAPEPDCSVVA